MPTSSSHHNDNTHAIVAFATMTMPNGGTATLKGTPENSFSEAVEKLEETHEQYLATGGWGGARRLEVKEDAEK